MLGTVNWNGRPLPVVSFEGALGKDVPVVTGRTRIVVFYANTGQLKDGFFRRTDAGLSAACARQSRCVEAGVTKTVGRIRRLCCAVFE